MEKVVEISSAHVSPSCDQGDQSHWALSVRAPDRNAAYQARSQEECGRHSTRLESLYLHGELDAFWGIPGTSAEVSQRYRPERLITSTGGVIAESSQSVYGGTRVSRLRLGAVPPSLCPRLNSPEDMRMLSAVLRKRVPL